MANEFLEPKAFSIDESGLENMLMNIGRGGPAQQVKAVSQDRDTSNKQSFKDLEKLNNIISELPEEKKIKCISLLEKYAIKFNMTIVCNYTSNISEEKCQIGSKENEILYNNFSIQGQWSGLEVIIMGDEGRPIVAKSRGQEWDNISKHFKIVEL
jgi:hypothetical protein